MQKVCGLKLRTYGVIVGLLYTIASLIGILYTLDNTARFVQFNKIRLSLSSIGKLANIKGFIWCNLVLYSSICCTTSILLVIGALKKRHKLITPWLINTFCLLFINTCYVLFLFIYIILQTFYHESFDNCLMHLVIFSWSLAIQIPIYNSVRDLYRECKDCKSENVENVNNM